GDTDRLILDDPETQRMFEFLPTSELVDAYLEALAWENSEEEIGVANPVFELEALEGSRDPYELIRIYLGGRVTDVLSEIAYRAAADGRRQVQISDRHRQLSHPVARM